jgi:hypothetical protein
MGAELMEEFAGGIEAGQALKAVAQAKRRGVPGSLIVQSHRSPIMLYAVWHSQAGFLSTPCLTEDCRYGLEQDDDVRLQRPF